jgi:hypothetical protein
MKRSSPVFLRKKIMVIVPTQNSLVIIVEPHFVNFGDEEVFV